MVHRTQLYKSLILFKFRWNCLKLSSKFFSISYGITDFLTFWSEIEFCRLKLLLRFRTFWKAASIENSKVLWVSSTHSFSTVREFFSLLKINFRKISKVTSCKNIIASLLKLWQTLGNKLLKNSLNIVLKNQKGFNQMYCNSKA